MIIKDLDYLENLTQSNEIVGSSAGVAVGARADAIGQNTYTNTRANAQAGSQLSDNDLLEFAVGKVTAVAVAEDSDNPQTSTSGSAEGFGDIGGGGGYKTNTYRVGKKSFSVGVGFAIGVGFK